MRRAPLGWLVLGPVAGLLVTGSVVAQGETDPDVRYFVGLQELTLGDLMDHWVREKQLNLHFDRGKLDSRVTLRTTSGVNEETLWAITNRELVAHDLACIQVAGEENLSIVDLEKAPALARIELDLRAAEAGYVRVLEKVWDADLATAEAALKPLLDDSKGRVTKIDSSSQILVAGLKPQVVQALDVLAAIDRPQDPPAVFEVSLRHASPVAVMTSVDQVTAAREAVSGKLRGDVISLKDRGSLMVIAPQHEIDEWRALIDMFDTAQRSETRHYHPRRFGLAETAELIETAVGSPAKTAGEADWRLVQDELSGALIVTALPATHRRVEETLERLDAAPPEAHSGMRSIPVHHRTVEEMLGLLQDLLDQGALPVAETLPVPAGPDGLEATPPSGGTGGTAKPFRWKDRLTLASDPGVNRILAIGERRLLDQVEALVGELDVHFPQVLVETLVVSLSESEALDLGVELQKLGSSSDARIQLASLFGLGSPDPATSVIPPAGGTGFSGVVLDPGEYSAVVRALETLNRGRTLTIPKVLVNNNRDATLTSVLQTPYTSTNASDTVATTSFGGTLDAGTTVQVTPQIADGDRLILDYRITLSSFVGDSVDPAVPPPRQENTLQSVVTVPDGHTVVLGGLEVTTESEAESQIPVLGSIPGLGRLFESSSTSQTQNRFFVFLRCSVLRSEGLEDLKYVSRESLAAAEWKSDWPSLEPLVIR